MKAKELEGFYEEFPGLSEVLRRHAVHTGAEGLFSPSDVVVRFQDLDEEFLSSRPGAKSGVSVDPVAGEKWVRSAFILSNLGRRTGGYAVVRTTRIREGRVRSLRKTVGRSFRLNLAKAQELGVVLVTVETRLKLRPLSSRVHELSHVIDIIRLPQGN